ncbi:hypothetical protein GHT06_020987 [Daphnia sinensis]|uniref:RING-type E3 ubiquitin transferase n=1 Tax=Daphnia sinensis TaxID=1820382 RepID=A0AAD5PMI2_9CRUS|nr:hypothetical protein GHT06_020987 [Daphnia sinensis]
MEDSLNSEDIPIVWPKQLPQLKNIDDRLHCPICYNYMKNPVISTACSHNFCSRCIRNNISLKNSCPICFIDISDGMLRPNRCLEEIIKSFQPVKSYVLKTLIDRIPTTGEEKLNENHCTGTTTDSVLPCSSSTSGSLLDGEGPPQKSSDLLMPSFASQLPQAADKSGLDKSTPISSSPLPAVDTQQSPMASCSQPRKPTPRASIHQQPQNTTKTIKEVPCPVCNTYMRDTLINVHLDACLEKTKPTKRKPMPKLIYNLIKDRELRKKLKDLGLDASGDKATLINRHKRFTILYNSECDAIDPRPVEELKAIFEQEEAESRRLANELRYASAKIKTNDIGKIEEENLQYLRNHKESYDRLINEIRQRPTLAVPSVQSPAEPTPVQVKSEPLKEEHNSEDEVTEIFVPPKVYEMICLSDSSDSGEPGGARAVSSAETSSPEGDNSRPSSSNYSIPDPMESGCSKDSSISISGQTITLSTTGSSDHYSTSPTCYSPVDESSNELFDHENSGIPTLPLDNTKFKKSNKRSKSPVSDISQRRMSLRRRL